MRVKIINDSAPKKRAAADNLDDNLSLPSSASLGEQEQENGKNANLKRVRINYEVPKISSSQQPLAPASASNKQAQHTTIYREADIFCDATPSTVIRTPDDRSGIDSSTIVPVSSATSILGDDDSLSQHSSVLNTSVSTETAGETAQPSTATAADAVIPYEPDVVLAPVTNQQHGFFRLLAYYIRWLQRQDKKQLFHHPVTEALAPGYRNVIQTPMDFETMSLKLHAGNYTYMAQFMADFHLLCWNATKYNKPSTNIYRAAKFLLSSGKRAFTYEKIETLKRSKQFVYIHGIERGRLNFHRYDLNTKRPYAPQLPGIGLSDSTEEGSSSSRQQQPNQIAKPFEAIPDNMTPEEILQQVRQKARAAAENVRKMPVQVKFGFVEAFELAPAGTDGEPMVTLRIVNPGGTTSADRYEQVPLGVLAGRIPTAYNGVGGSFEQQQSQTSFYNTSPVAAFVRNFPQPSHAAHEALFSTFYADYNAYSSALPYFDRRESVFTREDLTDLRSAYKSDRGMQYSEAMLRFARSTHPNVRAVIEKHLQKMTEKSTTKHSALVSVLGERLLQRRRNIDGEIRLRATATVKCDRLLDAQLSSDEKLLEAAAAQAGTEHAGSAVTAEASSSNIELAAEKAEVDFIDQLLQESSEDVLLSDADVQKALDLNAEVLFALCMQQTARLSENYETLRAVPFSTEMERELAELSVGLFKRLVRRASPEDVVSVQALRRAMGLPGVDETQHLSAESLLMLIKAPTSTIAPATVSMSA